MSCAVRSSVFLSLHTIKLLDCMPCLAASIQDTASGFGVSVICPSLRHKLRGGGTASFIVSGELDRVVFNASKAHFFSSNSTESITAVKASISSAELVSGCLLARTICLPCEKHCWQMNTLVTEPGHMRPFWPCSRQRIDACEWNDLSYNHADKVIRPFPCLAPMHMSLHASVS